MEIQLKRKKTEDNNYSKEKKKTINSQMNKNKVAVKKSNRTRRRSLQISRDKIEEKIRSRSTDQSFIKKQKYNLENSQEIHENTRKFKNFAQFKKLKEIREKSKNEELKQVSSFKARPVPVFKNPLKPMKSTKQLTIPIDMVFQTDLRAQKKQNLQKK